MSFKNQIKSFLEDSNGKYIQFSLWLSEEIHISSEEILSARGRKTKKENCMILVQVDRLPLALEELTPREMKEKLETIGEGEYIWTKKDNAETVQTTLDAVFGVGHGIDVLLHKQGSHTDFLPKENEIHFLPCETRGELRGWRFFLNPKEDKVRKKGQVIATKTRLKGGPEVTYLRRG